MIYINDLSGDLSSNAKLFADDTSLFNVAHNINTFANELNIDLKKVSNWTFQWKISFNPDPSKQVQEIIFSRKLKKVPRPRLVFNNVNVSQCKSQKHPDIILDSKLIFEEHYKTALSKKTQNYRTLTSTPKFAAKRSINNYLQRFC